MGGVLVISLAFVIINILVDIIYGVLDPTVSLKLGIPLLSICMNTITAEKPLQAYCLAE